MSGRSSFRSGGRQGVIAWAAVALLVAVLGIGLVGTLAAGADANTPAPPSAQPTPTPTDPTPTTPTPSDDGQQPVQPRPKALTIKAMGVHSTVVQLGLRAHTDQVEFPPVKRAGWYKRSAIPGQVGVSVVVGYIAKSRQQPGVFRNLGRLEKRDRITVRRDDGTRAVFTVTGIAKYKEGQFPTKRVYAQTGHAELRIVTCGGTLSPKDPPGNVVVSARLLKIQPSR